jgi:hypothetical protein
MKLSPLLLLTFTLAAPGVLGQQPAANQAETSRIDIFAGYSAWIPGATVDHASFPNDFRGAMTSGAYYFNRNFGVELAADYHYAQNNDSMYSFAIGPVYRQPQRYGFTLFAHALMGSGNVIGPFAPVKGSGYYDQLGPAWGPQLTLGGGVDYALPFFHHHLSLRLAQVDYLYEHVSFGNGLGSGNLNSVRLSTGLVLHLGSVLPPPPVTLACAATPQKVFSGDPVSVIGVGTNLDFRKQTVYRWRGVGARLDETGPITDVDTGNLVPGTYVVRGHVSEGNKAGQSANCAADFTVMPFAPPILSCSANPSTVTPGGTATIMAHGISPQNRALQYTFSTSGGALESNGKEATLRVGATASGVILISCGVSDDQHHSAVATTFVTVQAAPPSAMKQRSSEPRKDNAILFFERQGRLR